MDCQNQCPPTETLTIISKIYYIYKSHKKIRNDKCGICSKDVSQARMLNCLHSFCSSCLKMILLNGRITCPDCGETTMIDNVGDLPLDYTKLSHTSRSTRYLNHKTRLPISRIQGLLRIWNFDFTVKNNFRFWRSDRKGKSNTCNSPGRTVFSTQSVLN